MRIKRRFKKLKKAFARAASEKRQFDNEKRQFDNEKRQFDNEKKNNIEKKTVFKVILFELNKTCYNFVLTKKGLFMDLVKYNTREHHDILKVFAHSTKVEKKVFMNIAYELNKIKEGDYTENDLCPIEIPMDKLIERTEANYKAIFRVCEKITKKTTKLEINIVLKNGKTELFKTSEAIFPSCGISENVFRVKVNGAVIPCFSRALKKYRNYNIIEAKFLSHKHSIELYKYLKDKENQNISCFMISVSDFKNELGLKGKYKAFGDFKKRVLDPTKADLKKNSVLYFDYKEKKTCREVTHLYIDIIHNTKIETDIHTKELLTKYIKQAPEDAFKKDFEEFLKTEYCLNSDGKKLYKPQYISEMKILKSKKSLGEYNNKIQLQFAQWLQSDLFSTS